MKLLPPLTELERKKSPEDEYSSELELDDDDKSLLAARVPVAISRAAGASTALIVCHDEGALDRSSTSVVACCCRSLALCFGPTDSWLVPVAGADVVVVVVVVVVGLAMGVEAAVVGGEDGDCWGWLATAFVLRPLALGAGDCGKVFVSLALLWPKLAASLLDISETAPFSGAAGADRTATRRLMPPDAVGVDLITRRTRIRCCS